MDPTTIYVCCSITLGIHLGIHFLPRLLRKTPPRDMLTWGGAVERAAIEAIRADLYAAQTKAELVELIDHIPADFDASVFLSCQIAAGVHRAALQEAIAQGILRPETLATIYPPLAPPAPVVTSSMAPSSVGGPSGPPAPLRLVTPLQSVPATNTELLEWVDGRLVPRIASA